MLSMISKIYNPLGLATPFSLRENIFCKIYVETITLRMIKYHMFKLQTGGIGKENLVYNSI